MPRVKSGRLSGVLVVGLTAALSAQSGSWTAVRTIDKFDDSKEVSSRIIATVATLDKTKAVSFNFRNHDITMSCGVVNWDEAAKRFEVPESIQQADQQWQRWKESGGAPAFKARREGGPVNGGERYDPKIPHVVTQCCTEFEGNATCKSGIGSTPAPDVIACYSETVRRCVVDQDVRLLADVDVMKRLKDLEDSVSPNARETDLRKTINDLMGRLTTLESRLRTLEDGKKPTGRGGAAPER